MAEEMSKSAKRRAAKKARDAAAAEEEAPAPAPAPAKAPAKAAASAPAAAGYPTAKAKAKATPTPEPAVPKAKAKGKAAAPAPAPAPAPEPAQPKSKAKAKAKAAEAPAPAPEPAPKATAKSKASAKAKSKPKEEEPPATKKVEIEQPFELDDGKGADEWEVSTGLTKKQQKRQERLEEEKKMKAAEKQAGSAGNRYVPGFNASAGGAATSTQHIPGMGPAPKAGAKAQSQAVGASFAGVQKQIEADKIALAKAAAANQEGAAPKNDIILETATVTVQEKSIGIIIGPGGKRIKELKEKTGVTNIETNSNVITITGGAAAVAECENAIVELDKHGYTGLLFEDFGKESVTVPTTLLPEIIGKKGVSIIALKEACQVEIDIPKDTGSKSKCTITIAGSKENSKKAREAIESIKQFYHHEFTHPGQVHEEMEVEPYQYAWIIGKAGSEMRHIQKNFEVKVFIPRQGDENQNVVIVGEPKNVARAKTYIEKQLYSGEQNSKGRDRSDKAEDFWGDEGEDEPWMKQYLYKRK